MKGKGRVEKRGTRNAERGIVDRAFCGVDLYTGREWPDFQEIQFSEAPGDIKRAFECARDWYQRKNGFVHYIIERKVDFFNYGFSLKPQMDADGRGDSRKVSLPPSRVDLNGDGKTGETPVPLALNAERGTRNAELESWWSENEAEVRAYVETVWRDRLVYDNVVSFWRESSKPITLAPERCDYDDEMGKETLKYLPKNSNKIDRSMRDYMEGSIIKVHELPDADFLVLKRARVGDGFGWPEMYSMFRTLTQQESMEVGESTYAYAGRTVLRQHKLGFDPKQNMLKIPIPFFWTKERDEGIRKFMRTVKGFAEMTTNWDQEIAYVWIDPKAFDGEKWATIWQRLAYWGGALAFMLGGKGMSPYWMQIFKEEAGGERTRVGLHLAKVINEGFSPPVPVRCTWSNRCFQEPTVWMELLKNGLAAGVVSPQTFLEEVGFDPEVERARKKEALAERATWEPAYDPAHDTTGDRGGRPGGAKDPAVQGRKE